MEGWKFFKDIISGEKGPRINADVETKVSIDKQNITEVVVIVGVSILIIAAGIVLIKQLGK